MRKLLQFLLGSLAAAAGVAPVAAAEASPPKKLVVVIPVQDEISPPELYILRRGLKQAITDQADAVVLDLKTPGGAIDVTFDMMEAIGKFPGTTIAYVDDEAMSAGAFLSATTSEIWFAPDGVIGAAAPVTSSGQDVDATMKQKLVSYLKARMRAISEGKGHRGEVISAMIDADTELKIDGQVIKPKGELLSLTATEAMKAYGQPPAPLLGAGIAPDLNALLTKKFGANGFVVRRLEITWSERAAVLLNRLSPILLGLGLLSLFIEFKTPGFNIFGIAGVVLLVTVFFASRVAGLSGHEPLLFFLVGAVLLLLELAFFHSAGFLGVIGVLLIGGALVWSMADLWPGEPLTVAWSTRAFVAPVINLAVGMVIAVVLASALLRFLPRGWVWDRLIIGAAVGGSAQAAGEAPDDRSPLAALIGRRAVAATALRPVGQVEIEGRRYEARVDVGAIDAGASVVVRGRTDFGLIVEAAG
jgi:membrane-bound serine protease (ClpP class)